MRPQVGLLLAVAWLGSSAPSPGGDPIAARIESQIGRLASGPRLVIAGEVIFSKGVLPDLYRSRRFSAAWPDARSVDELLAFVRSVESDGLRPEDYHLHAIETLRPKRDTPEERADFDILLSDALARLGHHLYLGKVDATRLDPDWNGRPKVTARAANEWMRNALGSE